MPLHHQSATSIASTARQVLPAATAHTIVYTTPDHHPVQSQRHCARGAWARQPPSLGGINYTAPPGCMRAASTAARARRVPPLTTPLQLVVPHGRQRHISRCFFAAATPPWVPLPFAYVCARNISHRPAAACIQQTCHHRSTTPLACQPRLRPPTSSVSHIAVGVCVREPSPQPRAMPLSLHRAPLLNPGSPITPTPAPHLHIAHRHRHTPKFEYLHMACRTPPPAVIKKNSTLNNSTHQLNLSQTTHSQSAQQTTNSTEKKKKKRQQPVPRPAMASSHVASTAITACRASTVMRAGSRATTAITVWLSP